MYAALLSLATVAVGIGAGWQRLPDGGMEYIIQIEPQMLPMLEGGEEFFSDIPPDVRDIRSYRIKVGTGPLPKDTPPEPPAEPARESPTANEVRWPPAGPGQLPPGQTAAEARPGPFESASPQVPSAQGPASGTPAPEAPRKLNPPDDSHELAGFDGQAAAFVSREQVKPKADAASEGPEDAGATGPPKPPSVLVFALAGGMFGSMGGLLYVGWIAWDYRRQYQGLLARVIEAGQGRLVAEVSMHDPDSMEEPE
jgi:hypothetical protein